MAKAAEPFICGGLSGCLASSCIHPIDLSKVRLQLYATQNPGKTKPAFYTIIIQMIRQEGIASVYSGISAALSRQCVYGTARIGLHRTFSDAMVRSKGGRQLTFLEKVMSGMASGLIAVCIGTPFDVVLVRMQGDSMKPPESRRGYKNAFDALARIVREEGPSRLYRYYIMLSHTY
jgi:solute carrier family 25 oxoglutarate transporter 11